MDLVRRGRSGIRGETHSLTCSARIPQNAHLLHFMKAETIHRLSNGMADSKNL